MGNKTIIASIFASVIVVIALFILIAASVSVPQGYIGVERAFSGAIIRTLSPGFHFVNVFHRVEKVDNHYLVVDLTEDGTFADWQKASGDTGIALKDTYRAQIEQTLSCSVKGQQTAYIAVSFGYNYAPKEYINLRRKVAGDVETIVIRPLATDAVKSVASRFSANQLVTEREAFEKALKEALVSPLKEQGVNVQFVAVKGVFFTATFEQSLSKKALAEQAMKKSSLEAIQAEQQARLNEVVAVGKSAAKSLTEVATSRGELIKKEAEADAEKATLSAQAQASQMLSKSITTEINRYNATESWKGELPNEILIPQNTIETFLK